MSLQFDDVNSAPGTERILILTVGDGRGQSLALAVVRCLQAYSRSIS